MTNDNSRKRGLKAFEQRRGRLGREFVFHDDGKDRGEDWRCPQIGAPEAMTQECVDTMLARRPWLSTDQLLGMWDLRSEKDDKNAPGVASDIVNYIWTGALAQHGEENDAIRAAQAACLVLAHHEPDTLRRRDWRLIRNELTCEPVWMQMGPKRAQLTRRKLEYQERVFPVLNIGSGLIRIRRSIWLPPPNADPLFLAACEYVKRPDRVTSWSDACRKYLNPVMLKGALALDQLAKWFRPLVGRIVKEFWGYPKEFLTELGMIGLAQAIRDFPVGQINYSFAPYAETAIRREIHDHLRGSTIAERYLYANPAAMVEHIAANAGFENAADAKVHAAAALSKHDTETGPNRRFYDVREIGFDNGGEDGHGVYVASGYVDPYSLGTALLHATVSREIEQEVEATTEARRSLAPWARQVRGVKC